jgi:hypothetical protein
MKKYKVELIVILAVSIGATILLPNFFKSNTGIQFPDFFDFIIWTLIIFILLTLTFFAVKPPLDNETKKNMKPLPDGYQELYNTNNQVTKKGFFIGGKLCDGSKYVYKKDGVLSHIEIYKDGVHTGNSQTDKN